MFVSIRDDLLDSANRATEQSCHPAVEAGSGADEAVPGALAGKRSGEATDASKGILSPIPGGRSTLQYPYYPQV
jgi:hypothetical protein